MPKDRVRFVHGHAAWSPGQLQGELDHNQVWHTTILYRMSSGGVGVFFFCRGGRANKANLGRQELGASIPPRLASGEF